MEDGYTQNNGHNQKDGYTQNNGHNQKDGYTQNNGHNQKDGYTQNNTYNTSTPFIQYENNAQYRKWLRDIFKMDTSPIFKEIETKYNVNDLDEETLDEMTYDSDTMSQTMEQLYVLTESNILFQTIYDLAAAKMFSTDRTIGQVILFSYDYFYLFHACLCLFFHSPELFDETCSYYLELKEKLVKR
jgi:hypothetical protein